MTRVAAARRRYPVTFTVTALTALVGAAQFAFPAVLEALRRDPAGLRAGEWWRVATPLLVQSEGWSQYLFNAAGPLVGTVVGTATAAAVMATGRSGHLERLPVLLTALVVADAVAMIGLRDTHGVGVLTGLALGAILSAGRPSGAAGVLGPSG